MTSIIRSFDLLRSLQGHEEALAAVFLRVLQSGQVILGPEVQAFESEFAAFTGAKKAIGVASGTDALILALRAMDVGHGDEIITVANSAVPTASAIRAVGAIPVFADVDPVTLNMNVNSIRQLISQRTRALLPVHLYGLPVDMRPLLQIAAEHLLPVIEDCAHAHGAMDRDRHAGLIGHIGCFSFYPTKNLAALGDAGICITNDDAIAERLRTIRMYGFDDSRVAQCDGLNSRLDEVQAAILRYRLRQLPDANQRRRFIAEKYLCELQGLPLLLPATKADCVHAWHQFVIRVAHRSDFLRSMADRGIQCGIHYEHALHRMPAFARSEQAALPVTETAAEQVVSLPITPDLTDDEVSRVCKAVREVLTTAGMPSAAKRSSGDPA